MRAGRAKGRGRQAVPRMPLRRAVRLRQRPPCEGGPIWEDTKVGPQVTQPVTPLIPTLATLHVTIKRVKKIFYWF